jgi:hypothetical protein
MSRDAESHFFLQIRAPDGLAGIEAHLCGCALNLEAWTSGHNGKVVLRRRPGEERFEWDMDPSDTETMTASGCVFLPVDEAWRLLQSLSAALSAAGFPHEIAIDDEQGSPAYSCSHLW